MSRASSLLSICLVALLLNAVPLTQALAEVPGGYGEVVGTYAGLVEGGGCSKLDEAAVLMAESPSRNRIVGLLPYVEQDNFTATLDGNRLGFASDGLGTIFELKTCDGGAAVLTGFLDGPRAPERPATAFLRPFTKPGCELPAGAHAGMMRLDGSAIESVTFEILDARPGLFMARMIDESGRELDLVGSTAADGRFVATGVGDGVTVRMTGDVTLDRAGQPTAFEADFAIENRYGKPITNGIIAILIGLYM